MTVRINVCGALRNGMFNLEDILELIERVREATIIFLLGPWISTTWIDFNEILHTSSLAKNNGQIRL